MKRNKADMLLELGVSLCLTGCLVEQLRSRLEEMEALGYKLSSEELLAVNRSFNRECMRFLDLSEWYEKLRDGSGT